MNGITHLVILRNGSTVAKLLKNHAGMAAGSNHPAIPCRSVDLTGPLARLEAHLKTPAGHQFQTIHLHHADILLISDAPDSAPHSFGFLQE